MLPGRTGWQRNGKPAAHRCRLGLEQLESRLAPAVYHVNTFQDTPALNLITGQDASGHISLRSAVMAANVHSQDDAVVLGAGVYAVQNGAIEVGGNLRIVGEGIGQTAIETRHLDRLFEVEGGDLQLTGVELNGGSAATLFKGVVHLTDAEITDLDFAPGINALFSAKPNLPTVRSQVNTPPLVQPTATEQLRLPITPEHLFGQPGASSWWSAKDLSADQAQEPHQSFWRVDSEVPQEQPAPEKPADMKESSTRSVEIHVASNDVRSETNVTPANNEISLAMVKANLALAKNDIKELCVSHAGRNGGGQAITVLLAVGCVSVQKRAKKCCAGRGWVRDARHQRRTTKRWHDLPGESRRTRWPPASGPPNEAIKFIRYAGQTTVSALFCFWR
jgi:hypothetical protein